jgi:hypothetical protein
VLVDLQDVLSIGEIVVRIERGYDRLKGPIRRAVDNLFRSWNIGLALGGGGFTARLQRNPSEALTRKSRSLSEDCRCL